jgi:hypothetical protein
MSKSYSECCREVGLDRNKRIPELVYRWVGYSGGKLIECKSMTEAQQYALNERLSTPESVKARDDFFKSNIEKEKQAVNIFYKSLREDYLNISDELFEVCYAEAYKRGHSEGYDEVALCMAEVVEFAQKVRMTDSVV